MGLWTKITDLQNLESAWKKVRENNSVSGVDRVTVEDFEADYKGYLSDLANEITSFTYTPKPVKIVEILRNDKAREIGILCTRDKIVQQSVCQALTLLFEKRFSDNSYAYRPGRSAKMAGERVSRALSEGFSLVLESDIKDFFDSISHEKLMEILSKTIFEEQVLRLINLCIKAPLLKNGELETKKVGICQGGTLSPLLSNIYLSSFDRVMEGDNRVYVRYSDDFIVLAKDETMLHDIKEQAVRCLGEKQLRLKEEKTKILPVEKGFDFLGFHYDCNGQRTVQKARDSLSIRLEEVWCRDNGIPAENRVPKLEEVIRGWYQYYRAEDEAPGSIYEYIVDLKGAVQKYDGDAIEHLKKLRGRYSCYDPQLLRFMAEKWTQAGENRAALREYEECAGLSLPEMQEELKIDENILLQMLEVWKKVSAYPNMTEAYEELIQIYTDVGWYDRASRVFEKKNELLLQNIKNEDVEEKKRKFFTTSANSEVGLTFGYEELLIFYRLFVGREDMFAIETITEDGRRFYRHMEKPVTNEALREHIDGKCNIGTYVQRNNNTVKYMVLDVDISKKLLLQAGENEDKIGDALWLAHETGVRIKKESDKLGLKAYIEDSGYRGRHCWIFFEQWMRAQDAVTLGNAIVNKLKGIPDGINIELFPSTARMKSGKIGQLIKLPFGVHSKTGRRCFFLNEDGNVCEDQAAFLKEIKVSELKHVKRVVEMNRGVEPQRCAETGAMQKGRDIKEISVGGELTEAVLKGCPLMAYLCFKAKDTGYLTHYERLTLSYVFGHLGENGKRLLHRVLAFTLNYSHGTTEKFIKKIPGKPVSCVKLREEYKQVTAVTGCNCYFQLAKNCYPSPVLHAINKADSGEVTLPVSSYTQMDNEKSIQDQLNVNKKTEELAGRMLELKKQKRGIDKSIQKCEDELSQIFDNLETDRLEIEIGLLVRKKTGDICEWVIEI